MDKSAILNSNWAIMPEALKEIVSYDFSKLEDVVNSKIQEVADGGDSASTHKENLAKFMSQFEEKLYVDNSGTASIDISGPLMPNPGPMERYFLDAADSVRIAGLIRMAANSPDVKQLVMHINSPGGMVVGTPEVGNAVREFNEAGKTSYAFADTLMASAAYWIGSQATALYSTESAVVGSIGVIRPHVDATGYHEKMGLKVEVFRAGAHKVAGAMGTSLTDVQRDHIQAGVDKCHEQFKETVNTYRSVPAECMEGQTFYGKEACDLGLVDKVVKSIGSVIETAHAISEDDSMSISVDNTTGAMSNPKELNKDDDLKIEDVIAERDQLGEKVESLESSVDAKNAQISDLEGQVSELQSSATEASEKIESLEQELAEAKSAKDDLEKDFDEKVNAAAEEKAEELAESKAAKLAAQSGTEPAPVGASQGGESDDDQFASMSEAELWEHCSKIEDAEEKRKFYVQHIQVR